MNIILPHGDINKNKLETIKSQMKYYGSPTIRCVKKDMFLFALEGAHRIQAAYESGIEPKIELIKYEKNVFIDDLISDSTYKDMTLEEICEDVKDKPMLSFDHLWKTTFLDIDDFVVEKVKERTSRCEIF